MDHFHINRCHWDFVQEKKYTLSSFIEAYYEKKKVLVLVQFLVAINIKKG